MHASRVVRMVAIGLVAVESVVGCAVGTATPVVVSSPPVSPIPAPAKVAVYGSNLCTIVESSYSATVDREKFHCVEAMSDPRVNGESEAWITTNVSGTLGAWSGDIVFTNSGGTWRGTAEGTLSGIPSPRNYGEVVYTGEGGYAGLTYHVFLAGPNGSQLEAGWIAPAE